MNKILSLPEDLKQLKGVNYKKIKSCTFAKYTQTDTSHSTFVNVGDIAETATTNLDQIRADIGSVQNQLQVTINNITVTQVNVKAAESTIRDVDFAAESANFSKYNILAQSGSYAMSQANAVQQNVLKLLQ